MNSFGFYVLYNFFITVKIYGHNNYKIVALVIIYCFILCQVPVDELNQAAQLLCEALYIRAKYMALSLQSFNSTTAQSLETVNDEYKLDNLYNKLSEDSVDTPRRKYFVSLQSVNNKALKKLQVYKI